MIATNGKKACVIMDGDKVVTKILVLQPVYELEGDLLLKFAVDVKKGTTLFLIDNSTVVTANDDYKAGDYLYFSKGTFHPTAIIYYQYSDNSGSLNYYSEIRYLKDFDDSKVYSFKTGGWGDPSGLLSVKVFDVSHMSLPNCTHFIAAFKDCPNLTSLDVSNFDTSKVTDMSSMFYNCPSLTTLDVSNFDTSKVTDMHSMFCNCTSLTTLDVSGFDTSNVTDMYKMFYNCTSFTTLDVSNFDTNEVTDMRYMFYNCPSLTNLLFGSKWGTQTSTAANALTLDLSNLGSSKSYKLTDATYNSMLTMYDRATAGLTTMTIKFSKNHNLPDGFAEKMSALGYTITLV